MRDAFGREAGADMHPFGVRPDPQRRRVRLRWAAAVVLLVCGIGAAFAIASIKSGAWDIVIAPAVIAGAAGSGMIRRALDTDDEAIAIHVPHPELIGVAAAIVVALLAAGTALVASGRLGIAVLVAVAAGEGTRRLAFGLLREPVPERGPQSFEIYFGAADRLRDENIRGMLPRGM